MNEMNLEASLHNSERDFFWTRSEKRRQLDEKCN